MLFTISKGKCAWKKKLIFEKQLVAILKVFISQYTNIYPIVKWDNPPVNFLNIVFLR